MSSHYATVSVDISNLDGADGEVEEVEHIIVSALRGNGYKADCTVERYDAYPAKAPPAASVDPDALPMAAGCEHWRQEKRTDYCPMGHCQRCRYVRSL